MMDDIDEFRYYPDEVRKEFRETFESEKGWVIYIYNKIKDIITRR